MNSNASPTGLPGQPGITRHIPVPPVKLYEDATGKRWQLAEDGVEGRLFVPLGVNPADCLRTFWIREAVLRSFAGDLIPVGRAA
ncbi:hypothetical protein OOK31_25330 [Streptomyces sp. NBC_00249]|uniref:hypothetical protein n=1 Tax=Streptomyces sp. NBC_00249 TaxID=2975690 RepID=UPI0022532230|nr:hypothetical protein [Streptomyces sp. NBC_00249]MCX5197179.1 hypothetical protein [Streptomyces sp. NBC_00249]